MKLRFLGTGTSFGVPVIGCDCATCTSDDPRDQRTRHAALITTDAGANILIDTPADLRLQLLRAGVRSIEAVWYTHDHADHTHGIDDLRVFSARRGPVHVYAGPETAVSLGHRFAYIFDRNYHPPDGTTKPEIQLHELGGGSVSIAGVTISPLRVPHGDTFSFGLRLGDLAYITDAKYVPDDVIADLRGIRTLVLNALWFGNPHPTHFNIEEACETAARVGATQTYLTHLTHRVRHSDAAARLPAGVAFAYDGLTIEI